MPQDGSTCTVASHILTLFEYPARRSRDLLAGTHEAQALTPAAVWVAAVRCLCGPLPTCKAQTDASAQTPASSLLKLAICAILYRSSSETSRRVAKSRAVLFGKALGKAAKLPFGRLGC